MGMTLLNVGVDLKAIHIRRIQTNVLLSFMAAVAETTIVSPQRSYASKTAMNDFPKVPVRVINIPYMNMEFIKCIQKLYKHL